MPGDGGDDHGPDNGNLKKISNAWIFVSHSHHDIDAVRCVRDELERLHANPLLFFLLCLEKDEEVDGLIKREITARNFFLLCDSPEAQESGWVKKEREFVKSLKNRKIYEIDLRSSWDTQKHIIHEALGAATTLLNYTYKERDRVTPYIDLLVKNDFAVFSFEDSLLAGADVGGRLERAIESSLQGYFIAFVSKAWLQSRWAAAELNRYLGLAKSAKAGRPPVIVALDPISELLPLAPAEIRDLQWLDFSRGDIADHERQLLQYVELRDADEANPRPR
jgi:hypothetical protein